MCGGGHGSLDGGCHGFLSKAFGIMAHPLLMSALEDWGGWRKELKEREKRRGQRERREGIREGGDGGEGRGGSLLLMIIE